MNDCWTKSGLKSQHLDFLATAGENSHLFVLFIWFAPFHGLVECTLARDPSYSVPAKQPKKP